MSLVSFVSGTHDELKELNPVLPNGAVGVEIDTNKYKVGDGNTAWNTINYNAVPSESNGNSGGSSSGGSATLPDGTNLHAMIDMGNA